MRLNILYQFNEKYVPFAGISITSLFENNKDVAEIFVYILGEEICQASQTKLRTVGRQYKRNIIFIDTKNTIEKMKKLGIPEYRGSYSANIKMFIADYLCDDIERLIYIDSDTIVTGNLSELNSIDLQNKPLAMTLDSLGKRHKLQIGIDKDEGYFNSGIILFDIAKWKDMLCTERIIEHVRKVRMHYMAPDQDLINVVLKGEIAQLDMNFNVQPIHLITTPRLYYLFFGKENYYSDNQIEKAVMQPTILHFFRFLGEFPWHKNSIHPDTLQFDKYMNLSLWKDYKKEMSECNSGIFKFEKWIYLHVPKFVFLILFKIAYELFLWKANKDSLQKKNNKFM